MLPALNNAGEKFRSVEAWTKSEGKDIDHTFKSIKSQVKDAIKEIKKDFDL
jgi:gas vesicle protein